jgi:hypothetical protein
MERGQNMSELKRWHPACAVAFLSFFEKYKSHFEMITEFGLHKNPLSIDILVLKKSNEIVFDHSLGRHFRAHNLIEYKSPDDNFLMRDFDRTLAYVAYYCSHEGVSHDDVTVTILTSHEPRAVLSHLNQKGIANSNPKKGYYKTTFGDFDFTMVDTRYLENDAFLLKVLRPNISQAEFIEAIEIMRNSGQQLYDNAYLNVLVKANPTLAKEGHTMEELIMYAKEQNHPLIAEVEETAIAEERTRLEANVKRMYMNGQLQISQVEGLLSFKSESELSELTRTWPIERSKAKSKGGFTP